MRDGAEGLESDVHVSLDSVVVMFHDSDLSRTTGSKGLIRERNWYGDDGIQHCRTIKEPRQAIPTFSETIALLMRPENRHVKFDVDVKAQNDPERLFTLMHEIISGQEDWETTLAPRVILGLWHPRFIVAAIKIMPYLRRSYIGASIALARDYFWDSCQAFSIHFAALATTEGARFRKDAQAAGKDILVWTVNKPEQMMECYRWGVQAILTDNTHVWLDLRKALQEDHNKETEFGRLFLFLSPLYYAPLQMGISILQKRVLEKIAGPFEKVSVDQTTAAAVKLPAPPTAATPTVAPSTVAPSTVAPPPPAPATITVSA